MLRRLLIASLLSLSFISNLQGATLIDHVDVYWTLGGQSESQTGIQPGARITIERDPGSGVDVRITKKASAPSTVTYTLTDWNNSYTESKTTTGSFWYFSDRVGPLNTEVWASINTNEGLVSITVLNAATSSPDLVVSNLRVDGSTSPRDFRVGETVNLQSIVYNQGGASAGSSRVGYYLGTSATDTSRRWGDDAVSSLSPDTGSNEEELYTFQASDVGTRYFISVADYQNTVGEGANEGNNRRAFGPFNVLACLKPAAPNIPNPSDGAVLTTQPAVLDWADASGAQSYDVWIDSSFAGSSSASQLDVLATLTPGDHTWQVRANNSCGSTDGPLWRFTIQPQSSLRVDVRFADGTYVDGGDLNALQLWRVGDTAPLYEIDPATGTAIFEGLQPNTAYRVDVYGTDMLIGSTGSMMLVAGANTAEILAPAPGRLRVKVVYSDGTTVLAGASVELRSHEGRIWRSGTSAADGWTSWGGSPQAFAFPNTQPGEIWSVTVSVGGQATLPQQITIQAGALTEAVIITNQVPENPIAVLFGTPQRSTTVELFEEIYTVHELAKADQPDATIPLPFREVNGSTPATLDAFVDDPQLARLILQAWAFDSGIGDIEAHRRQVYEPLLEHYNPGSFLTDFAEAALPGMTMFSKRRHVRTEIGHLALWAAGEVLKAKIVGPVDRYSAVWDAMNQLADLASCPYPPESLRNEIQALLLAQTMLGGSLPTFDGLLQCTELPDPELLVHLKDGTDQILDVTAIAAEYTEARISAEVGDLRSYMIHSGNLQDRLDELHLGLVVDAAEDWIFNDILGWEGLDEELQIAAWLSDAHAEGISLLSSDLDERSRRLKELREGSDSSHARGETAHLFDDIFYREAQVLWPLVAEHFGVQLVHLQRVRTSADPLTAAWVGATQQNIDAVAKSFQDAREDYLSPAALKHRTYLRNVVVRWAGYEGALSALRDRGAGFALRLNPADGSKVYRSETTRIDLRLRNDSTLSLAVQLSSPVPGPRGITVAALEPVTIPGGGEVSVPLDVTVPPDWFTQDPANGTQNSLPLPLTWSLGGETFHKVFEVPTTIAGRGQFDEISAGKNLYRPGEVAVIQFHYSGVPASSPTVIGFLLNPRDGSPLSLGFDTQGQGSAVVGFQTPQGPFGPYSVKAWLYEPFGEILLPEVYTHRVFYLVPSVMGDLDSFDPQNALVIYPAADAEAALDIQSILELPSSALIKVEDYSLEALRQMAAGSNTILVGGAGANPLVNDLVQQGRLATPLDENGDAFIEVVGNAFDQRTSIVVAGYRLVDTQVAALGLVDALEHRRSPVLRVEPDTLGLGSVNVGSSALGTFTVHNDGTSILNGSAQTEVPFAIVSGSPYSLVPGDSTEVSVRFTPSGGGLFTGTVTFTGGLGATANVQGTGVAAPQPPAAPTWLRTTPSSPTSIDLLWDDNANDEDGFKVERKEGPAGAWTVIATLPANATTYQDTGLTCGRTYAYRVWAFNSAGDSGTTNEAGATPECPCNESLTPESASFDALGGTGSFNVTACGPWTAVSDAGWVTVTSGASGSGNGAVGFRVDRSNVQSARTGSISLPELGLTFTVQQAAAPADPGFTSFLRLVSGTVAGQTVDPDHRTVTVQAGSAINGSLTLQIDSSFSSNAVMAMGITPSWGDHAMSYTDLGHFSTPASGLLRNATIAATAPLTPGTYHVIAAYRGELNAGQVMSATNWSVGTLVWNNGDDIAGWAAGLIGTANRDGNVLADYLHNVNIPTWVPATAITIVVEAPTPQPPAAPTWLRTTPSSSTSIDLLWDDNANDEDGFNVERKEGPAGPWTIIATLPANATTYQDAGLTCGTTYAYRVWAFNSAGDSGTTNEAGATPDCAPESGMLLSDDFEDGASAGWQTWVSGWSESGGAYHGTETGADLRNETVWTEGYDWSDYTGEVDLALLGTHGPADGQLLLRYNSETDRIACRLFQFGSSRELQLLAPGRPMLSVPFSYATGQTYRLRASAVRDSVTCEVVGHPATRLVQTSLGSRTGTVGLRNTHIAVSFDDLEVRGEADRTFSDSFESGDPTGWTSHIGSVTVRPGLAGAGGQARYLGGHGLKIDLANGSPAFVQASLPGWEASYRARFAVNLRGLSMTEGDELDLFTGYDGADPVSPTASGDLLFRLVVRQLGGTRWLTAFAWLDDGTEVEIPSAIPLADGWRIVEIRWARSSGTGDGTLDLWVDGVPGSGLQGLDNDLQGARFIRWGAVSGASPQISGSFELDEFDARRVNPIGPLPVFTDVPVSSTYWPQVQGLYAAELTSGCALRRYCPDLNVTRAEMAVFLVRGMQGPDFVPPSPSGIFSDVPVTHWAAGFVEQLHADGITGGCAIQPLRFCPETAVNRAEMAVFLLRARHGGLYVPPPPTGTVFADIPASYWAAPWIEQLHAEGITGGCGGGNYCPTSPVTRWQVAYFLGRTFGLPPQQPAP